MLYRECLELIAEGYLFWRARHRPPWRPGQRLGNMFNWIGYRRAIGLDD